LAAGCDFTPASPQTILVSASVTQNADSTVARVAVSSGDFPLVDAAVSVNGYFCLPTNTGVYTAALPSLLPGDAVTLSIQVPGTDIAVTRSLTLPSTPPVDPFALAEAPAGTIPVRTALETVPPDLIEVHVSGADTHNGGDYVAYFAGASPSLVLPASVFSPYLLSPSVTLTAESTVALDGSAFDPGSSFTVSNGEVIALSNVE
jgi:hypothetical protein